jgi:hypothetical protein
MVRDCKGLLLIAQFQCSAFMKNYLPVDSAAFAILKKLRARKNISLREYLSGWKMDSSTSAVVVPA